MSKRQQRLPIHALERIDDLCAEFERKWQNGEEPSIEDSLSEVAPGIEQDVLLAELIALDIDYQRRRGLFPTAQDYQEAFPHAAEAIAEALGENQKHGGTFEPPTVGRLADMFPALEIVELVGVGGMGAVYKARQPGLDRVVALKILPEEFGHDIKFALRFTREARTLAKLNHPNIVSVYEFGKTEETYFFLMEFIDGSTLRDVVEAGQLSPKHALTIVPHLCDALQFAHDNGVIHRDIKPDNILISTDGTVKIADFGLSRILGNDGQQEFLTATHQVMGTPRYMAPEQLEGSREVDHLADIYSLGVVFYEMLTGELPIGRFAPPSKKAQIDVRLDEVVLRTLEKEPRRRYQHASQIKSDVQSIASGKENLIAPTLTYDTNTSSTVEKSTAQLAQQELASRMLLTRRQLMERVKRTLRPLYAGQFIQIVFGILFIAIGAQCWARNTHIPHRLVNGIILHVYGVIVIAQAANVLTKIKRIDYSKPVADIRNRLSLLRTVYLRAGIIVGFAWWLMWIPLCVAIGFDAVVVYFNSLAVSLAVGVVGFIASLWLYLKAIRSSNNDTESWKASFAGESIANAYRELDDIEQAKIE